MPAMMSTPDVINTAELKHEAKRTRDRLLAQRYDVSSLAGLH